MQPRLQHRHQDKTPRRSSRRTNLDKHLASRRLQKEIQRHLVQLRQSPRQLLPTRQQLTRSSSTHRQQTANNRIWATRLEDPALDAALLEEGVPADEGVVQEEGAALGAPGEADTTANPAQEEEAPEQDEYVEVEVDSETLSIYEPLPPSGDEADNLPEEPSSSTAPAPVGSGSLSSRTPLVLRPRQPGYPPVRIDREGNPCNPLLLNLPTPPFRTKLPILIAFQTRLGLILRHLPAPTAQLESVWGFRTTSLRPHPRVLPQAHRVQGAGQLQRLQSRKPERPRVEGWLLKKHLLRKRLNGQLHKPRSCLYLVCALPRQRVLATWFHQGPRQKPPAVSFHQGHHFICQGTSS